MHSNGQRIPRFAALIVVLLVAVGAVSAVALGADPPRGTVSQEEPAATWQGETVRGGGTRAFCSQPGATETDVCDVYELTADVDPKFWEEFEGGAEVAIQWTDPADNFNMAVYDKNGKLVGTGVSPAGTSERVLIEDANRGGSPYRVIVYLNHLTEPERTSTYDGGVLLKFRADVEPGGGGPIPTEPVSAAPCTDGLAAGVFPCKDVDLESFLPLDAIGGGKLNDIWGWTDPETGREYAIVGKRNGTAFVDVTDAQNPRYLGDLPTFGLESPVFNIWRDAKVYKNHAFIVSEEPAHGMQVFDLTRLRGVTSPRTWTEEPGAHYARFGNAHNISINEETGFAYVIGTLTCGGGSHIVNITNPKSPQFAGCVSQDGYTHDNQCVTYDGPDQRFTGQEICFDFNEDTVTIVDVTDKGAPKQLARLPYEGAQYTHQGWLTEDRRHVLVNDELDEQGSSVNTTTRIFNVEKLDNPSLVGAFVHPTAAIDHNNYVKGSRVFQSNYRAGLRVLDTRRAGEGTLDPVGFFDVYPEDNKAEFNGTWSNYPFFKSGIVIVSGIEQGLFVVRPRTEQQEQQQQQQEQQQQEQQQQRQQQQPPRQDPQAQGSSSQPQSSADNSAPCARAAALRSATARPRGRRVDLSFSRAAKTPVTVDVFQTSVGRRVIGERLVARFTGRDEPFRWNGRANRRGRKVTDGYYFVRFRMKRVDGQTEVRRKTLRRVDGRFSKRPAFYRRDSCGTLRSYKLERPVFGGRTNRSVGIAYHLNRAASVSVVVRRGSKVIRRYRTRERQALQTYRLRLDSEQLRRGDYKVTITVRRGDATERSTLTTRRL